MESLGYSHETPKLQWEPSFTGKYKKEEKMKKSILVAALVASLLGGAVTPAFAVEPTPDPTIAPRDRTAILAFKEAMTEFKSDVATYRQGTRRS